MGELEEKPVRDEYAKELTELTTDREQAWTTEKAIEEQIEKESKELQPLLAAVRGLAQSRTLYDYVFEQWRDASRNDQSALKPVLDKIGEQKLSADEDVKRLKAENEEAVNRLFVLFRLRARTTKGNSG